MTKNKVFFFFFFASQRRSWGFWPSEPPQERRRQQTLLRRRHVGVVAMSDLSDLSVVFEKAWVERKPLLARGAFSVDDLRVDPDEMAGLAMEGDVCARVVTTGQWHASPVSEELVTRRLEAPWSILVNDAEKVMPTVGAFAARAFDSELRARAWLRDDVMVSLSSEGGGIGAHCDSSDVVLLQCAGTRRWRLESAPLSKADEAKRRDHRTRSLRDFTPDEEFVLTPGDFLFVPARVPHDGVALEDLSVTCSFGFRTMHESSSLLDSFLLDVDEAEETSTPRGEDKRHYYEEKVDDDDDPLALSRIASPLGGSRLPETAVGVLRDSLRRAFERTLQDETKLVSLLGRLATTPRDSPGDFDDVDTGGCCWDAALADFVGGDLVEEPSCRQVIDDDVVAHHAAGARFATIQDGSLLAVNGRTLRVPPTARNLARAVADHRRLDASTLRPLLVDGDAQTFLQRLLDRGDLIAIDERQR
eukprot:CAMPEP_0118903560 /NCGR_PEP_ID=MMETSP1166-20130328/8372_1 /TAXON_ID=1104430 /ORGANISM="Chrysoreinhardia sp, Strain CCMP3193" /LENGTH=473 /DNA_ID=CAMNT_0006842789 /DNA_START=1 /DNA_END=1422 /DNA_ORIENTATION=+